MEDKGTGIASALNWFMNCIIGAATPYGIEWVTEERKKDQNVGYVFLLCSILSFCGLIFIIKFMKETKGLSREQIEYMFSDNKEYKGKHAHKRLVEDLNDTDTMESSY